MSISVTVSGEDATSVALEQVLSDAVTVSGSNSIQVTTTSGDAATVTISTGDPVTVTGNYSNYVTGDVVRPNEISDFLTSTQISSNIDSAIDSLIDTDALNTLNELTAALNDDENFASATVISISNLNSATGQLSTATGLLVQKSETGNFITDSDTGAFYAASNPSGFIDAADLSSYVQDSETGLFLVSGEDAVVNNFTTLSNVGIKINTPSAELDVNGSVKIRGTLDMTDNGILNSTYNGGSF